VTEKTLTKAELQQLVQALERDLDEIGGRLAEAEAKRDEYLADLRRLAADFDNYRKRAAR
jgi:molecular chaperone GrpE (heat shock protein)